MTKEYHQKFFTLTRESYIVAVNVLSRLRTSSMSGRDFAVYQFDNDREKTVFANPSRRTMELSDKLDDSIAKIIEGIVEGLNDSRR